MDELTAFITARLDEDEDEAREALRAHPGPWSADHASINDAAGNTVVYDEYHWGGSAFAHIVRHEPARVLRQVKALQVLVSIHNPGTDPCDAHDAAMRTVPCEVLTCVAAIYSDHPDYRQEWENGAPDLPT